jgi:hypothetical protein
MMCVAYLRMVLALVSTTQIVVLVHVSATHRQQAFHVNVWVSLSYALAVMTVALTYVTLPPCDVLVSPAAQIVQRI